MPAMIFGALASLDSGFRRSDQEKSIYSQTLRRVHSHALDSCFRRKDESANCNPGRTSSC